MQARRWQQTGEGRAAVRYRTWASISEAWRVRGTCRNVCTSVVAICAVVSKTQGAGQRREMLGQARPLGGRVDHLVRQSSCTQAAGRVVRCRGAAGRLAGCVHRWAAVASTSHLFHSDSSGLVVLGGGVALTAGAAGALGGAVAPVVVAIVPAGGVAAPVIVPARRARGGGKGCAPTLRPQPWRSLLAEALEAARGRLL